MARLLCECDAFVFDCDGTLYQAGTLLPHVAEAIRHLRQLRKRVFFVTNTSSRSREQLCAKLRGMQVPCESQECVPSCVFTANCIRHTHPEATRVYVIGGQGVIDELAKVGIAASGGPADDGVSFSEDEFVGLAQEIQSERYDGVVVGWDTGLTYRKIAKAAMVFQCHPGAFFYATNDDAADRVGAHLLPGNGPLLKAVEAACAACAPLRIGRKPPHGVEAAVLGKPNPDFVRWIAEGDKLDIAKAVMVGDRLDTDILMGRRAGMKTLFVLTGVDGLSQIAEKDIQPDFTLTSVGSLWTRRAGEASSKM